MPKTINITGQGKISVKPDQIRLCLAMTGSSGSYDDTVSLSASETDKLKKCFVGLGFDKADLKTTSFRIDAKYENYRDENNDYHQRFVGYEYHHSAYIAFDADNKILSKVLSALADSGTAPEFRIEYTVKDSENARKELIASAVKDASEKAECIASAAGVTLGAIENISYSFEPNEIVARPLERTMLCSAKNSDGFNIEPDDISLTDSITITWSLL